MDTPSAPLPLASPLFEVRHLSKRYGETTVVNDVSFSMAPGECLGVIGPNGAGKTTTMHLQMPKLHSKIKGDYIL